MSYEAVIFDLDGTLVHTRPEYHKFIIQKTLNKIGGTLPSEDLIKKFWFEANRSVTVEECFGIKPEVFWPVFVNTSLPHVKKDYVELYPDVMDFIIGLKIKGYKTGVVTGTSPGNADMEIKLVGRRFFDSVVVAHSKTGIAKKPHPVSLELCLEQLQVSSEEAVYIGNADEDIELSRNAGVYDILIDREEYPFKTQPSLVVKSLDELYEFFEIETFK